MVIANVHTLVVRGIYNKEKLISPELTGGSFKSFKRADGNFPYTKYDEENSSSNRVKLSFWNSMISLFSNKAAVGLTTKNRYISEYTNVMGVTEFALYSAVDGTMKALRYLGDDKTEEYKLAGWVAGETSDNSCGEAMVIALLPEALKDDEFKEHYNKAKEIFQGGLDSKENQENFQRELCFMQSNLSWRISSPELQSALNVPFLKEWSNEIKDFMAVDKIANIKKTRATSVIEGKFNVLEPVAAQDDNSTTGNSETDFNGMYAFGVNHKGERGVPVLGKEIIIPDEAHIVCSHAKAMPEFRNFLFRGEAGSGKSMLAKIIAAGVEKPHGILTCSTNTEIFDLMGQILPVISKPGDMSDSEKKLISDVIDIGGFSNKNISEILNLPSVEDIFYDPDGCFECLSGKSKSDVKTEEVIGLWQEKMNSQLQRVLSAISKGEGSNGAPKYTYAETPFLRAIRDGGVIELQEPNVIAQPGVMVGLNGIMEHGGSLTLPTGERIDRHPDAIVVVTTNVSYEGCRDMNVSLLDRMDMAFDINTPPVAVMVERAMAQTGFTDEKALTEMAQIVKDINATMKEQGISDGTSGDRSLLSWALSAKLTGDVYTSAMYTLLPKCTANDEDRALLQKRLNASSFASRRKKRI